MKHLRFVRRFALFALSFLLTAQPALAQRGGAAPGFPGLYRASVEPHWFAANTKFWYREDSAKEKREFILVDAREGKREPAFDHARVASALAGHTTADITADHLPIDSIDSAIAHANWRDRRGSTA